MNKEIMEITDIADLKNISVDYLEAKYGYKAFKGEQVTRVNSSPKIIYYGKGKFVGSFIFGQNGLRQIILTPIIPGSNAPNYPSEEYQNIKRDYCVSILRDLYGDESSSDSIGTYWEKGDITIGCSVILEGKDIYCGGDIFVVFRYAQQRAK